MVAARGPCLLRPAPTGPFYVDPSGHGRDSLGQSTSPGDVAAVVAGVVAADKAVQREREARWSYLQGAYRDPHAARAARDELVKNQGWTSAAARVASDPLQLGEPRQGGVVHGGRGAQGAESGPARGRSGTLSWNVSGAASCVRRIALLGSAGPCRGFLAGQLRERRCEDIEIIAASLEDVLKRVIDLALEL